MSSSVAPSTAAPPPAPDSITSSASSSEFDEDEYEAELARQEWDRLVSQTKLLVGLAVPFFAAYFGRRVAFKGAFSNLPSLLYAVARP